MTGDNMKKSKRGDTFEIKATPLGHCTYAGVRPGPGPRLQSLSLIFHGGSPAEEALEGMVGEEIAIMQLADSGPEWPGDPLPEFPWRVDAKGVNGWTTMAAFHVEADAWEHARKYTEARVLKDGEIRGVWDGKRFTGPDRERAGSRIPLYRFLEEGLQAAGIHVWRQAQNGRHEQDRYDAYLWLRRYCQKRAAQVDPVPTDPSAKKDNA